GIGTVIHFTALHLHRYFRNAFGYKPGDYPNAEFIGERTLSLPLSPAFSTQDIKDVIAAVLKLATYYHR
ncbi:MAG: DegT/DnrJ/EryC1/StrS family aminotransferase, partial [Patescibacteria group bacterium]